MRGNGIWSRVFRRPDKMYISGKLLAILVVATLVPVIVWMALAQQEIAILWLCLGFCAVVFFDVMTNLKVNPPTRSGKKIHAVFTACMIAVVFAICFFAMLYFVARAYFPDVLAGILG